MGMVAEDEREFYTCTTACMLDWVHSIWLSSLLAQQARFLHLYFCFEWRVLITGEDKTEVVSTSEIRICGDCK